MFTAQGKSLRQVFATLDIAIAQFVQNARLAGGQGQGLFVIRLGTGPIALILTAPAASWGRAMPSCFRAAGKALGRSLSILAKSMCSWRIGSKVDPTKCFRHNRAPEMGTNPLHLIFDGQFGAFVSLFMLKSSKVAVSESQKLFFAFFRFCSM